MFDIYGRSLRCHSFVPPRHFPQLRRHVYENAISLKRQCVNLNDKINSLHVLNLANCVGRVLYKLPLHLKRCCAGKLGINAAFNLPALNLPEKEPETRNTARLTRAHRNEILLNGLFRRTLLRGPFFKDRKKGKRFTNK